MKKQSKKEKVLMYLQTYGSITPQDAYELFQSMRLGALIHIVSTLEGKSGYARYTLKDGVYEDYDNSSNSSSN